MHPGLRFFLYGLIAFQSILVGNPFRLGSLRQSHEIHAGLWVYFRADNVVFGGRAGK